MIEALEYVSYVVARDPIPKTAIYVNCLMQYCTTNQEIETMINIVHLIENLLPDDIEVLKRFSSVNRIDDALGIDDETNFETISKYNLSIKKLESRGLIVETEEDTGIESSAPMREVYKGTGYPSSFLTKLYQPLHIGQELLTIIKM